MSAIPKMCFHKILPRDLRLPVPAGRMRTIMRAGKPRAIMPVGERWTNGTQLSIRFMGGNSQQHQAVANVAVEWEKHAIIKLNFNETSDEEIRIAFEVDGAWSYLGTDNLDIPRHAATLNFGFMDDGTILQKFGHARGLSHERRNPTGGIQWDEAEVIRSLSGPPNHWDVATIRSNLLRKYSVDQINGTQFDGDSIMLYAFPTSWTTNGVSTRANETLSSTDVLFIASVYPKDHGADVATLPVYELPYVAATIKKSGEEDLFDRKASEIGKYVIETRGDTDVVMKLFGPDSQTNLVAEDDDSGQRRKARIQAELSRGKYLVQVRHSSAESGTGDYRIADSRR